MLSPGLLTEPACAATKHGKLTTGKKRRSPTTTAQIPSSSRHHHSPIGSAHGSPQEDRAKGVTAALRQARGTGERRFPRRRAATGGPVRGSLSLIPAPPKHAPFHVHSPHSPSHSLHGAEAGKRRNSAPVPVCANTPATGTPSRGCNYTVHTVRLPARTEGMRAPTAHRRGVPAPVRPVPFGSYGFPGEPGVQSGGTSPGSSHGGRRWPSRHAALLRAPLPALVCHAPLTGSVLRAVSGVLGVPAGQLPGCRAGGGGCCRSSAGCVSRASCRSRI